MKIRRVTATPINFPLEAPYGWVFGELPGFTQTIVEVETDDGRVGLGEASGAGASVHINDTFAARLVGRDPIDIAGAEFCCLPFWTGVQSINDPGRIAAFGAVEMALFNPDRLGGAHFSAAIESMLQAMLQTPAVRLPGDRRLQQRAAHETGVAVPCELVDLLTRYSEHGSPAATP